MEVIESGNVSAPVSDPVEKWKEVLDRKTACAITMTCMDFRFCLKQRHAVRTHFDVKDMDLIMIPGGVYSLVRPTDETPRRMKFWEAAQVIAYESIQAAIELHCVPKFIACSHEKCGIVSRDGHKFSRFGEEKRFHAHMLQAVQMEIQKMFTGLDVKRSFVYVDQDGLIQVSDLAEYL